MPVTVLGLNTPVHVDFAHDVAPVLSRLGCNAGTCHGSAQGKNGFKLSLRGYDPIFDVRALTDDQAARHVNLASPDDSMMLLEADRRRAPRRRRLDAAGRAVLRNHALLDRRRRQARPDDAARDQDRGLPGQPGRPADRRQAAASRAGDLRQRRGPRRDPRGVPRERQLRGRRGRPRRADHGGAPRRGADPGAVRGQLRLHDADRHGRPHRLRLGRPARPTARSTSWSPPSGSG